MILKYGEEEGLKKYLTWKKNVSLAGKGKNIGKVNTSKASFIEKYGEEIGIQKHTDMRNKMSKRRKGGICPNSKENLIKKYGQEEGIKKHNELRKRNSERNKGKISTSKEYFIQKLGEEAGIARYNLFIKRCKDSKKGNHVSLERFIERWGQTEGQKRYNAYRTNQTISRSLEGYITRFGEIEGTKKYFDKKNKTYSQISQELFWLITKQLTDEQLKNINFAEYNREKQILLTNDDHIILGYKQFHFLVDFCLGNKVIEFNGIYWHTLKPGYDEKKLQILKNKGYDVLVIDEREFNGSNKSLAVVDKCVLFLNS